MRGGIFDRIVLIQDDVSVRFRDRDHRRINGIAAEGAPDFTETDLFRIPAGTGFDPAKPFRIQLLVQREVGPIEKVFQTFDLAYQLPPQYLRLVTPPAPETAPAAAAPIVQEETQAQAELWKRIWRDSQGKIAVLAVMLAVLTGVFFFQHFAVRNERRFYVFRMIYLAVTLIVLGWMFNAQLSVVNIMALTGSLMTGIRAAASRSAMSLAVGPITVTS